MRADPLRETLLPTACDEAKVCRCAKEVIDVTALAMRAGLSARDLQATMFAYPTSASDLGYAVATVAPGAGRGAEATVIQDADLRGVARVAKTVALIDAKGLRYWLALLAACGVFLLFAALQWRANITPTRSLVLACVITAATAAAFAAVWPSRPWRWGVLLSSVFWLYLLCVFGAFALQGDFAWWPLIDGVIIVSIACAGAAAGKAFSPRPTS